MSTIEWLAKQLAAKDTENKRLLRANEVLASDLTFAQSESRNAWRRFEEQSDINTNLRDQLQSLQSTTRQAISAQMVDGLDKIPAIKLVKERGGYGLKEAKDIVDLWIERGVLIHHRAPRADMQGSLEYTGGL